MASTSTKTRTAPASKRAAVEPATAEVDEQPLDDTELDDRTLDGVIVSPDLVFVTPKKERPSTPATPIKFSIDGEVYTIIRPAKLQEAIAGLIESGARRATEADVLFAGAAFLRKVLAPESLQRINARLEDDRDDFEITDLFDNLERIALALIRSAPAAPRTGPVPARRRAVNR